MHRPLGRKFVTKFCIICKKPFEDFPSCKTQTCGSKECVHQIKVQNILGKTWKWSYNNPAQRKQAKVEKEKDERNEHLKTIFTGGYDNEKEIQILHSYSEGEIL